MCALIHHTPTHISVHFTFAASQCASPVHFLTVTARTDLGVPGVELLLPGLTKSPGTIIPLVKNRFDLSNEIGKPQHLTMYLV